MANDVTLRGIGQARLTETGENNSIKTQFKQGNQPLLFLNEIRKDWNVILRKPRFYYGQYARTREAVLFSMNFKILFHGISRHFFRLSNL